LAITPNLIPIRGFKMNLNIPEGVLWGLIGFIALEAFRWVKGLATTKEQLKDKTVQELTVSVEELTDMAMRLKYAMESLEKAVAPIPRLEKDVNEAHFKIREVEKRIPGV
jgi:exonuclease VII small subunit